MGASRSKGGGRNGYGWRSSRSNPRHESTAYRKRVVAWRRKLEKDPALAVCWICGEAIDMSLPVLHARSFTLDHLVPLAKGGDVMGEVKPAHRECNSQRGDGRRTKRGATPPTLLDW